MKPFSNNAEMQQPSTVKFSIEISTMELQSLDLSQKMLKNKGSTLKKCCATIFRQNSMKLACKPLSTIDLSISKVSASESIGKRRKIVKYGGINGWGTP